MKEKEPFWQSIRFWIIYSLAITLLLLFVFLQKPKPVATTLTKKEVITRVEVAKGNVAVNKDGGLSVYGEGIKLDVDTTLLTSFTKYYQPEWIVGLEYDPFASDFVLRGGRRIIGQIYLTAGVRASIAPTIALKGASFGACVVF